MSKRSIIIVLCLLVSVIMYADIQFIAPANGTPLTVGTNCQIQWSGPPSESAQLVTVFIATTSESEVGIVDNTHTKGQGGFTWEVGRLQNGDLWKTGGPVKMWLESDDGDSGEHTITLVEQTFGLDLPVAGETLTIGTTYHVQWHGPTYEASQLVTMFLEKPSVNWYQIADDTHTKGQGGFMWEVGRLKNGTMASPGNYRISLESPDGDYMGPTVTLTGVSFYKPIKDFYKEIGKIRIFPDPPCPMCFKLDLKDIRILLAKSRQPHVLKLYKGNQFVALLGKMNKRQSLPDSAKMKLNKNQINKLKENGKIQFQLRIFSSKGKLLHQQNVTLQLSKQNLMKLKQTMFKTTQIK